MRIMGPPLRFLGVVIGGWVTVRTAVLVPWLEEAEAEEVRVVAPGYEDSPFDPSPFVSSEVETRSRAVPHAPVRPRRTTLLDFARSERVGVKVLRSTEAPEARPSAFAFTSREAPPASTSRDAPSAASSLPSAPPALAPLSTPTPSRWSGSAYLFVREGSGGALAAGSALGGSQVGGRLLYRVADRLHASARAYSPLNGHGSEAALGLDWQPVRGLPVRLLAERRQRMGREGRSAFSLTAYGGGSERKVAGPVVMDVYAQAGVVGAEARDLFADGSVRVSAKMDSVRVGIGGWGAAQPGVGRVDVGPQASVGVPVRGANLRLFADYRVRVAGDARPGSGPTLTLASDF